MGRFGVIEDMGSLSGKITSWDDEKGYGFISPEKAGRRVFFHVNDFSRRHKRPEEGLVVFYDLSRDSKGRICAVDVLPELSYEEISIADVQRVFSTFISSLFLGIVTVFTLANKLPAVVLFVYLLMSALTYALYAQDKRLAQSGGRRTSESTLHSFSLIGGWPGAAIAQSFLRHKSKKESFRTAYWKTVSGNFFILAIIFIIKDYTIIFKVAKAISDLITYLDLFFEL